MTNYLKGHWDYSYSISFRYMAAIGPYLTSIKIVHI